GPRSAVACSRRTRRAFSPRISSRITRAVKRRRASIGRFVRCRDSRTCRCSVRGSHGKPLGDRRVALVTSGTEPFAARLHFITRFTSRVQTVLVGLLRRYFVRAPSWVLLTTRGRRTGLPREVLLPCERFEGGGLVISTYDRR